MTRAATLSFAAGPVLGLLECAHQVAGWSAGTASRIRLALEMLPKGELPYKFAELLGVIRVNGDWCDDARAQLREAASVAHRLESNATAVGHAR